MHAHSEVLLWVGVRRGTNPLPQEAPGEQRVGQRQLETAKARAWARLTAPPAVAPSLSHSDETVDVDEAARLLGMSRSWVYRHAARLPFARRVGRRALRFSTSGIRRYLASRGG